MFSLFGKKKEAKKEASKAEEVKAGEAKAQVSDTQSAGKAEYRFPEGLYTDVRIEDVFGTSILLRNLQLTQNKTKRDTGALIRVYDGKRWYLSSTCDINGIQSEIDSLAAMATPNPSIDSDPVVALLEVNTGEHFVFEKNNVADVPNADKLAKLDALKGVVEGREEVSMSNIYYIDNHTRKRIISSKGSDLSFDMQRVALAMGYVLNCNGTPVNGMTQICSNSFGELPDPAERAREELEEYLKWGNEGKQIEAGEYTVIMSPLVAGVFAHESFGHKSESDFMVGDEAMMREWTMGKRVGSELLSIVDYGAHPGTGYVPFDDEGCKTRETYLINKGVLTGRLHSAGTAAKLGEGLTGNARAINFEFEPIVRMTGTYICPGELTKEELFAGVKDGLFVKSFNYGTGMSTFTIAPNLCYRIRDGKLAEPVKVSVVTGSVMKTLNLIDGVSNELELFSLGLGGCGKMEQSGLPVSMGGPYVRISSITAQ